jgi:hypothetical protein
MRARGSTEMKLESVGEQNGVCDGEKPRSFSTQTEAQSG